MTDRFTQSIDWLAFTIPSMTVDEACTVIGGDWVKIETGYRRYPVSWICSAGSLGVGRLASGAKRNPKEVHADISGGIVAAWAEEKVRTVLHWIFRHHGHITRIDVALDDRIPLVTVEQVKHAYEDGLAVTRSHKFKAIEQSSNRDGRSEGQSLYLGSRQSDTMLRVYDKRLELVAKERPDAEEYGVRWELEFKDDRAQACAKALVNLPPEDWREFVVGLLRGYVNFKETSREAKAYEKYRAPLLPWWVELTEGFKTARLVVQKGSTSLDDLCQWLANSVSPALAVAYCKRGEPWLRELIYTGSKKWKNKHFALLNEGRHGVPYRLRPVERDDELPGQTPGAEGQQ